MRLTLALIALALTINVAAQDAQIELRPVASGLEMPVAITHAGDSRLFITLQCARVVIYDGTRILPTPFLDIRSIVMCGGEQGLLSVAFHPRYRENGFFFVYYVDLNGDLVIARYSISSDPNRADPNSRVLILNIRHPSQPNHNGGQLQFGPDGYLYIGTGDGGGGGDQPNNAQNLTTLLGKMLRIDVDNGSPYAIPPSNPFNGLDSARDEIWAYGLRNPWRFTFDRENGDLWIADVGQNEWEEVNLQRASSIGGENYGWRRMEGAHCFNPASNCNDGSLVLPVLEYNQAGPACSVTGGYRYRGNEMLRLRGRYLYGDFCDGRLFVASENIDGTFTSRTLLSTGTTISTFGEDIRGEVYLADYDGTLFRIVDTAPPLPFRRRAAGQRR
jgi:hypothetical protein